MKLKVKETIADILAYLLQVERKKLLWTNSGTAIGAQTISLALSDFDEVEVEFCVTDAFSNDDHVFSRCRVGGKGLGQWWCVNQSAGSNYGAINSVSRSFSASTTGVTFQSGQMLYAGTSYFNWNNRCVPVRIYGIKYGGGYCVSQLLQCFQPFSGLGVA